MDNAIPQFIFRASMKTSSGGIPHSKTRLHKFLVIRR